MIHVHILINAFIIIILLHLLISNLTNSNDNSSSEELLFKRNKIEKYENKSLEFLENLELDRDSLTPSNSSISHQQVGEEDIPDLTFKNMEKMSNLNRKEQKQNLPNTITPANTYDKMDSLNVPNFESNVLNFNKFYKINDNSYASLRDSKKIDDVKTKNIRTNYINSVSTPQNSVSVSPRPFNSIDTGKIASRPSRGIHDRWEYVNDLPMNGGMFGSIVGLDSTESLYSSFDGSGVSFKKCAEEVFERIPHNDLRKPVVYN